MTQCRFHDCLNSVATPQTSTTAVLTIPIVKMTEVCAPYPPSIPATHVAINPPPAQIAMVIPSKADQPSPKQWYRRQRKQNMIAQANPNVAMTG